MWDYGGGSGGIGQASSIVMDADLPPIVTNFRSTSGHFSNLGGTEMLELELSHGDGSVTDVQFELDPDLGRKLVSWIGLRLRAGPPNDSDGEADHPATGD